MSRYFDAIKDGILISDKGRRVIYANPAAAEMLGIEGSMAGMDCAEIFGLPKGSCILDHALRKDAAHSMRHELPLHEGRRRVLELSLSRVGDEVCATMREITESVKLEEILERYAEGLTILYELSSVFLSENQMSRAMETSLQLIRDYYGADYVLVCAPAPEDGEEALEVVAGSGWLDRQVSGIRFPLDEQTLIGRSMIQSCPTVVMDFSKPGDITMTELLRQSGVMSGICVPMVVEDRALGVMAVLYKSPREIDTAELWYMNVATNTLAVYIEKQRSLGRLLDSEKFLSSVLEGIGEGVIVIDRNYRIISANKGFLESHKLNVEDALGQCCHKVTHHVDRPCHMDGGNCSVKIVFDTAQPASSVHKHFTSDGGVIDVETNAYPIFDSSGNVVAAVVTVMDVTARLRLERDLEKRVKELEEFYDMAVGRELRMIELKEEIKSLKEELAALRTKVK